MADRSAPRRRKLVQVRRGVDCLFGFAVDLASPVSTGAILLAILAEVNYYLRQLTDANSVPEDRQRPVSTKPALAGGFRFILAQSVPPHSAPIPVIPRG